MKNMSKTLIIASVIAVALSACDKKEDTATGSKVTPPPISAPSTPAPSTDMPPANSGSTTPPNPNEPAMP